MSVNFELTDWATILKKCLTDLKVNNPKLSLSQLASKLEMARSTLNDQYNTKKFLSKPNLDIYLKIILESGNGQMLLEAIQAYDEKLAKNLNEVLSVESNLKNVEYASKELENLLENRSIFLTYILAINENGVSKDLLKEIIGSTYESAILTLKNKNIIIEENNLIRTKIPTSLIRSVESIKFHINTYADFYKPQNAGTGINYILTFSRFLNSVGIEKVNIAFKTFNQILLDIIEDEANKGDIPMFMVAFFDIFTNKIESSENIDDNKNKVTSEEGDIYEIQ